MATGDLAASFKITDPYADAGGDWLLPYEDKSSFVPKDSQNTGFVNGLTGLLSKAADTYLDVWGTKAKVASLYPTGQTSPGVVNAQQTALSQQGSQVTNLKPWLIGGGIAVAAIVLLVVIAKK